MQEMVKCNGRITHLHRPNRIRIEIQWEHVITCPRITEQTGHVLETEIVAEVFPPVAEDDNDYSIVPSSALKTFATIVHTNQSSHVCSMVESRVLQSKVKLKEKKYIPAQFQMAIKLNLHILKIIFICKSSHHLQILLMFIVFFFILI